MPDVKIEPWMREAAKKIKDPFGWNDKTGRECYPGIEATAQLIATAYAAREQGGELRRAIDFAIEQCEHALQRMTTPAGASDVSMAIQALKSALAGESR